MGWLGERRKPRLSSVGVYDSTFEDTSENMPIFYTFRSNGMALDFHQLHTPDPEQFSSYIFNDTWRRNTWPLLQPTYTQYLVMVTEIGRLTVDLQAVNESTSQSPIGHCAYAIRSKLYEARARIYLNPSWRSEQPDDMEFVLIRRGDLGYSLMLIRRSGPIAYRIQMVEKPVGSSFWLSAEPRTERIILG